MSYPAVVLCDACQRRLPMRAQTIPVMEFSIAGRFVHLCEECLKRHAPYEDDALRIAIADIFAATAMQEYRRKLKAEEVRPCSCELKSSPQRKRR